LVWDDRELHHIIPEESETTVHEVVTEKLGYRKLYSCWVPKMLTDNHKTKRMCSVLKFLMRYTQEGVECLDSIVTGDETWVFCHTSRSKQQSLLWCHTHSPNSKGRWQPSMTRGYRSWFQDLINVWTWLRPLYLYFLDTPHI
jgi:hypothetical protein